MGWLSGLMWCAGGVGALSVTVGALLFVYQDRLLYIPSVPIRDPDDNPRGYRNPLEQGISYEDMYMPTLDGIKIHGWLLKSPEASKVPTLVYFHGNAGNIGFRLVNARQMQLAIGCNVLMVDYRGYGKSEGTPTEEGLMLDVEASLRALRESPKSGVHPDKLILFGRSLGGAVALAGADRYPDLVRAVIVENTFISVSHMVDQLMPMLSGIKWLVLRLRWDNEEKARRLTRPVLYISGLKDELIPPWHMRALYNASPERSGGGKRIFTVKDGTHNDTWERGGLEYLQALRSFMEEVFAGKTVEMTPSVSVAQPSKAVGTSGDNSCEVPVGGGANGLEKKAVASS
ncbi:unnamed protein product [Ectocarpus sp. 12 AP-2014]